MKIYLTGNEEGVPVYRRAFLQKRSVKQLWSFWKFKIGSVKPIEIKKMVKGIEHAKD